MRRVRWTLGCFGLAAGATAFMALFLPATLARWSGASSLEAVRPWMALVAGLATMTAGLASAVAVSPRRYAHLLLVLALGLGTASASLQASDAPAAAAVATAVAALVLGAALLAAYLALWLADSPSFATAERDRAILRSALETLVPAGGRVASGAADPRIERAILQVYRRSGRWGGVRLRLALRLVDATSLWLARARFERIDAGTRHLVLERLLGASHRLFRRPIGELRAVTLGRFYADPAVQAAIGFDDRYLRTRLQEGPNAIAHAASLAAASALQAESEAAAADASGASTGDPAAGPTVLAERLQPLRLVRAGPFRP